MFRPHINRIHLFYYARRIVPKGIRVCEAYLRVILVEPELHSFFRRNVAAVASRCNTASNLTGLRFETQTSRYRDARVTTRPTGQFDQKHTTRIIERALLYSFLFAVNPKSNQIFYYTRYFMPMRLTSLRTPSPHHCAQAIQLLSKKTSMRRRVVGSTVYD